MRTHNLRRSPRGAHHRFAADLDAPAGDGSVWLAPNDGGAAGWVTVRAVVTRGRVPAYSGVALVKLTA
ncbi:hypothetical protein ACIO8F_10555 [Streptomyces sp. NPDC087228]|uniref:hypothetical protein n=1 Tax=Streptomyces sp. NPDC087228 TaxID=3365772 RepID=UPI0038087CAB